MPIEDRNENYDRKMHVSFRKLLPTILAITTAFGFGIRHSRAHYVPGISEIRETAIVRQIDDVFGIYHPRKLQPFFSTYDFPERENILCSSQAYLSNGHRNFQFLCDDNVKTYFKGSGEIRFDLDDTYTVDSGLLSFFTKDGSNQNIQVYVSEDKSEWTELFSVSSSDKRDSKNPEIVYFEPVDANYIKIVADDKSLNTLIREFIVYGKPAVTEEICEIEKIAVQEESVVLDEDKTDTDISDVVENKAVHLGLYGVDYAWGVKASAKGFWGSSEPKYAVDGDMRTIYQSDSNDGYISLDLGEIVTLDKIIVNWYWNSDYNSGQTNISVSYDGKNWKTVARRDVPASKNNTDIIYDFSPTYCRYIRFEREYGEGWWHVANIEAYGPTEEPDTEVIRDTEVIIDSFENADNDVQSGVSSVKAETEQDESYETSIDRQIVKQDPQPEPTEIPVERPIGMSDDEWNYILTIQNQYDNLENISLEEYVEGHNKYMYGYMIDGYDNLFFVEVRDKDFNVSSCLEILMMDGNVMLTSYDYETGNRTAVNVSGFVEDKLLETYEFRKAGGKTSQLIYSDIISDLYDVQGNTVRITDVLDEVMEVNECQIIDNDNGEYVFEFDVKSYPSYPSFRMRIEGDTTELYETSHGLPIFIEMDAFEENTLRAAAGRYIEYVQGGKQDWQKLTVHEQANLFKGALEQIVAQ